MAAFREGKQGSGVRLSPGPSLPAATMMVRLWLWQQQPCAVVAVSLPAGTLPGSPFRQHQLHPLALCRGQGRWACPQSFSPRSTLPHLQDRARAWAATGIISLRDQQLQSVPEQLWQAEIAAKARAADLGGNRLETLPPGIRQLVSLQRLRLSHNWLTVEGLPWDALAGLSQLATLVLDSNR